MPGLSRRGVLAAAGSTVLSLPGLARAAGPADLLNASYDPTREFYRDFDTLFAADWKQRTG